MWPENVIKLFCEEKPNHIVKQTLCIADRRMVSVQCTLFSKKSNINCKQLPNLNLRHRKHRYGTAIT